MTCVYGVNTFLAIRRWRLGSGCQGTTQSNEYIRARTASRGEMEARPELVWVPAANRTNWGKAAARAATDLWSPHPRGGASGRCLAPGRRLKRPQSQELEKQWGHLRFAFERDGRLQMFGSLFFFFFREFHVSLWKMSFEQKVNVCVAYFSPLWPRTCEATCSRWYQSLSYFPEQTRHFPCMGLDCLHWHWYRSKFIVSIQIDH